MSVRSPNTGWRVGSGGWCCSRNEEEARRGEQAVRESGAEWTIVHSSFQPELQRELLPEPILAEARAIPVDGVAEPFVNAEDLADVAVAALTEEGHAGQLCEVTAPRRLTFAKAVGEISRVSGREIRYVPISVEQFASAVEAFVLPPEFVGLLTYLFTEVLDGRNAHLTDGVRRALGREPRDFYSLRARPPQPASGTADDERHPLRYSANLRPSILNTPAYASALSLRVLRERPYETRSRACQ
jgi:uncharacterized protein YbjT (DUF2867 family)